MKNLVKFWLTAQGYLSATGEFRNGILFGFQHGSQVFAGVQDEDGLFSLISFDMKTGRKDRKRYCRAHKSYTVIKLGVMEACNILLNPADDVDALISEAGQLLGHQYGKLLELAKREGIEADLFEAPTSQFVPMLQHLYPF